MAYHGFDVLSTKRGYGPNPIITSHLFDQNSGRTLCGRDPKGMSRQYGTFMPKWDCKNCQRELAKREASLPVPAAD